MEYSKQDLTNSNFSNRDFSRCNFMATKLNGCTCEHTHFDAANLEDAQLYGASLTNATFCGTNLIHAQLVGADLTKADLSGANLEGADIRRCIFKQANLSNANLRDTNVKGSQFINCQGLTQDMRRDLRNKGASVSDFSLGTQDSSWWFRFLHYILIPLISVAVGSGGILGILNNSTLDCLQPQSANIVEPENEVSNTLITSQPIYSENNT